MQDATWSKATNKVCKRASTLAGTNASAGQRAQLWNSYSVSVLPYPAQATPPPRGFKEQAQRLETD
eukprot:10136015-Alexandrium_andersonii.AAC.1